MRRHHYFILYYLPFLLCVLSLSSCSDKDPITGPVPIITWKMSGGRFTTYTGETIMLVPDIENIDETTTYQWSIDGKTVGTADSYTFLSETTGEYYIAFHVTNKFGSADDEVKVTVKERTTELWPEIPRNDSTFTWKFPFTDINIPIGRDIHLRPYMQTCNNGVTYTWTMDGTTISNTQETVFTGTSEGQYLLNLTATRNDSILGTQDFTINVCPAAGVYRRNQSGASMVNKIFEYMPAPGHQVNGYIIVGESFPKGCTHEQACNIVLDHFRNRWMASLGGQGGYLIAGFDHSVPNKGNEYDLCIKGNPFNYQSEPGIIWVSQDVNGDGLPNDLWYELAGSEYGTTNERQEYAVTYYRPQDACSSVGWRDLDGTEDYIPYMSYWNPQPYYWQDWQESDEMTFFGTRLLSHHTYANGYSDIPPYDWGYADNYGSDFIEGPEGKMGYYHIQQARTWDGKEANLQYIDFVKVQTAQTGWTPNLGDISTEIYYIGEVK